MLDPNSTAERLKRAIEVAYQLWHTRAPLVNTKARLARECAALMNEPCTPQTVGSWFKTGRMDKKWIASVETVLGASLGFGRTEPMPSLPHLPVSANLPRNSRVVWVVGHGQGGFSESIWSDGDYPVGATDEYTEASTIDEQAFVTRVVGDSMAPRYMPGEYALVEPNSIPEIEDDVLVRLASGETMIKRLLSRRAGAIRLGSYNVSAPVMNFQPEEITWMYYIAHPIPAKRIKHRIEADDHHVDTDHKRDASSPNDGLLGGISQLGGLDEIPATPSKRGSK